MKYLYTSESVIIPRQLNNPTSKIDTFDRLKEFGEQNNFDVVRYNEFYNSLEKEEYKKTAPMPNKAPFFALFHPIRKKPMFVLEDEGFLRLPIFSNIVRDIIGHERVHQSQSSRMTDKIEYTLPDPKKMSTYFSNKEEIMAFSWSISNAISKNIKSIEEARGKSIRSLLSNSMELHLWKDIVKNVDTKVRKRYQKYIYLYLVEMFSDRSNSHIDRDGNLILSERISMKYLNTSLKLFKENKDESSGIRKYEIVEFTESFTIDNIYGGENKNISLKINTGEKLKMYFDTNNTNDDQYYITAIRPLIASEKEGNKYKEKTSFILSDLWEGNFILNKPIIISKNNLPFRIENYI